MIEDDFEHQHKEQVEEEEEEEEEEEATQEVGGKLPLRKHSVDCISH